MPTNYPDKKDQLSPVFARQLDTPEYHSFLDTLVENAGQYEVATFSFPMKGYDPLACLELFGIESDFRFYWEKPEDDFALSGGGELVRLKSSGTDRFQDISAKIKHLSEASAEFSPVPHSYSGLFFLGGCSFFDINGAKQWDHFDSASFTVPEWLIVKEGNLGLLTVAVNLIDPPISAESLDLQIRRKLHRFSRLFELEEIELKEIPRNRIISLHTQDLENDRERWMQSVERAKQYIQEGIFEKIVLARETKVETEQPLQPTLVLNRLRKKYQNCYSFLIASGRSGAFIGTSPERLVKFRKNFMLTEALAGSIKRGASATDDAVLEEKLLQSTKDLSEHNYVVSSIVERLQPFVNKIEKGSSPLVKKLTNVQHLYTPITAWLKDETDRVSIVESLHPTPAVGGYPWHSASGYISELEHFDRGWYAGPVGWLNKHGGGEFSVSIRSALLQGTDARFYAGCGIVADSEPQKEWEETNLKLMPMLSALQHE